jgi:hypothetical protein
MFEGIAPGWKHQLQLPLIQNGHRCAIRSPRYIGRSGLPEIGREYPDRHAYNIAQRSSAKDEFKKIGARVWKLLPNQSPQLVTPELALRRSLQLHIIAAAVLRVESVLKHETH